MKFRVPLDLERACSGRGLLATDAGNPCSQLRQFLAKRFDLSEIAAGIRIAAPERGTIRTLLVLGSERRRESLHSDPVALFNLLHQAIGLGEQKISVEREDVESRLHSRGDVDEHHALGTKTRCNFNVATKSYEPPPQQVFRIPLLN